MQRRVVLIFGQTGSGKTRRASAMFSQSPRALVVEAGFNEFPAQSFDDYKAMVLHLESIRAFSRFDVDPLRLSATPFRVSYTPLSVEHGLIFDTARLLGNMELYLEEADRFEDPRRLPEYDEVITRGRHYGVGIIACALHPYKVPKELRRQATEIISYRQYDPNDIEWLAEVVGEAAYELTTLPPFHCLRWTPSEGPIFQSPDGKTTKGLTNP